MDRTTYNINSGSPFKPSLSDLRHLIEKSTLVIPSRIDESSILLQGIATDSRKVIPQSLFIAINGEKEDGWKYLDAALNNGAKVIIGEKELTIEDKKLLEQYQAIYLKVFDSRLVVSKLAPAFYGFPARSLQIIGVTGTNGKTTTTTLLYNLFSKLGYRCGLIGTIENRFADYIEPAKLTTPDAISLQELFYRMVQAKCEYLFMEVSSHALAQHRTEGIPFRGAIFTNLTRDHLDYHGDMLHYQKAKKILFDNLSKDSFALLNGDEKASTFMIQNCVAKSYFYALHSPANISARILEKDFNGTELLINGTSVWVRLTGEFNMYNLLSVYGTAKFLLPEIKENDLLKAISSLDHATGRFEVIRSDRCTAIIDYAHTPDALIKVLDTIADVANKQSKIFVVVGAGGNRDKGKRPIMAKEAYLRCDQLILTSDNPRFENPKEILEEMKAGLSQDEQARILSIEDRREAIRTAIQMANAQDVVLVAGKGHESYQEIKGIRYHFNDREEIKNILGITTK